MIIKSTFPIVSVVNDSFQEYTDEWSLVLFCKGCNLDCKECHNKKAIEATPIIANDAFKFIDNNINKNTTAIVFLGGEPTLHDQGLIDALIYAKFKGRKTKIFTNGMFPQVIAKIGREQLCDFISFDIKCIRNMPEVLFESNSDNPDSYYKYRYANEYCNNYPTLLDMSIKFAQKYLIPFELRTTKWDCILDQLDDIKAYVKQHYPNINHIIQEKVTMIDE